MVAAGILRSDTAAAKDGQGDRAPILSVGTLTIMAAYLMVLSATAALIALSKVAPPQIADPTSFTTVVSIVGPDGKNATGTFVTTPESTVAAADVLFDRPEVRAFFFLSGMAFAASSATLVALLMIGNEGGWRCRVIASAFVVNGMIFEFMAVWIWGGLVCFGSWFGINSAVFVGLVFWVPCMVRFAWLL